MDSESMKEHMEQGWDFVFICVLDNEDKWHINKMKVISVDWEEEGAILSPYDTPAAQLSDLTPFEEMFPSKEEAEHFIDFAEV